MSITIADYPRAHEFFFDVARRTFPGMFGDPTRFYKVQARNPSIFCWKIVVPGEIVVFGFGRTEPFVVFMSWPKLSDDQPKEHPLGGFITDAEGISDKFPEPSTLIKSIHRAVWVSPIESTIQLMDIANIIEGKIPDMPRTASLTVERDIQEHEHAWKDSQS